MNAVHVRSWQNAGFLACFAPRIPRLRTAPELLCPDRSAPHQAWLDKGLECVANGESAVNHQADRRRMEPWVQGKRSESCRVDVFFKHVNRYRKIERQDLAVELIRLSGNPCERGPCLQKAQWPVRIVRIRSQDLVNPGLQKRTLFTWHTSWIAKSLFVIKSNALAECTELAPDSHDRPSGERLRSLVTFASNCSLNDGHRHGKEKRSRGDVRHPCVRDVAEEPGADRAARDNDKKSRRDDGRTQSSVHA